MNEYQEKLNSLGFRGRTPAPKVIEERDSDGSGSTITQHWDDRQDVDVTPKTLYYDLSTQSASQED